MLSRPQCAALLSYLQGLKNSLRTVVSLRPIGHWPRALVTDSNQRSSSAPTSRRQLQVHFHLTLFIVLILSWAVILIHESDLWTYLRVFVGMDLAKSCLEWPGNPRPQYPAESGWWRPWQLCDETQDLVDCYTISILSASPGCKTAVSPVF